MEAAAWGAEFAGDVVTADQASDLLGPRPRAVPGSPEKLVPDGRGQVAEEPGAPGFLAEGVAAS